jgi:hypothetical protein
MHDAVRRVHHEDTRNMSFLVRGRPASFNEAAIGENRANSVGFLLRVRSNGSPYATFSSGAFQLIFVEFGSGFVSTECGLPCLKITFVMFRVKVGCCRQFQPGRPSFDALAGRKARPFMAGFIKASPWSPIYCLTIEIGAPPHELAK